MANPFDRDFFKFLFGFLCILITSFVVIYLAGTYDNKDAMEAAAVLGM